MTRLSEIDDQALSALVSHQLICHTCGVIDTDYGRLMNGYRCSTCDAEGTGGHLAFPINIQKLLNLVQQAYHSTSPRDSDNGPRESDIGTVIYFCTLREALLNRFLETHLLARRVPTSLILRLLDDNKLASQKFGKLFSSATGTPWDEAVSVSSSRAGMDFRPVAVLMRSAAKLRNEFLHEGRGWAITRDVATECVDSLGTLVALFAELHNAYTHPLVRGDA